MHHIIKDKLFFTLRAQDQNHDVLYPTVLGVVKKRHLGVEIFFVFFSQQLMPVPSCWLVNCKMRSLGFEASINLSS